MREEKDRMEEKRRDEEEEERIERGCKGREDFERWRKEEERTKEQR